MLEDLNLSDNRISDIDTLSNLTNLRVINLSNNAVNDITPLMNLNNLEFLDVSGNKVPQQQVLEIREIGVNTIY